jgi:hypothetical protein
MTALLALDPRKGIVEEPELVLASDEGRFEAPGRAR